MNATHSLKAGDILVSSWGYEQTNVDFYQVVKATRATVKFVKIRSEVVSEKSMSGTKVAVRDSFEGPTLSRRVQADGYVRIDQSSCARPWNGNPQPFTSYH